MRAGGIQVRLSFNLRFVYIYYLLYLVAGSLPNAKTVLNWFFKKRPNKETLVSQGIYKNEPIFGNTLERLYEASDKNRPIPAFVLRCTEILENPPHVLSVGKYFPSTD